MQWSWPVRGPLLSTFRYGPDPFARGQRRGIRIGAPLGTPVRSACAGRVRFSGSAGTSGRTVSIACGRYLATYLHLGAVAVWSGQALARGERLGAVGASGRPRARAPHLAFGVRLLDRRWGYIDPLALLPGDPGAPPPSLLPPPDGRPRLGPAPRREPTPVPVPVPVRVPRPVAVGAPARASPVAPTETLPPAGWLGLAALAGALVAVPGGRRAARRRRRRTALARAR